MKFLRIMLKTYRILLLILFILVMGSASFVLYHFYDFIQPVEYATVSVGSVTEPGLLEVTVSSSIDTPIGAVLISPSGKNYSQSSDDIENICGGNSRTLKILTADVGEWSIKYRDIKGAKVSVSRNFNKSGAAILVSTKATRSTDNETDITVSMNMSSKNYEYTMKAVQRSNGFSLTSSGEGGATLNLAPYPYAGVWDFYLNTTRNGESYSTMFSYTF